MHPLDMFLLFAIANVVAWPVALYVDTDMLRIIGHMIVCTVGSLIGGFIALQLWPDASKYMLIWGGFVGAGLLLYLLRFRKWR